MLIIIIIIIFKENRFTNHILNPYFLLVEKLIARPQAKRAYMIFLHLNQYFGSCRHLRTLPLRYWRLCNA